MQNKLPLAKNRNTYKIKPDKDAYIKCCAVSSTPASVDYMVKNVAKNIPELLPLTEEYRDSVHAQRNRENPFPPKSGDKAADKEEITVLSDFENYQKNLCNIGLQVLLKNITGEIKIDFAVSDSSEMIRRFQVGKEDFSPESAAAMDKVLNYLLANKNMVSKNGVIYEAVDGKVKEVAGKPVIATEAKVVQVMLVDLPNFLKDNNLQTTSQKHQFRAQAPDVAVKPMPEPVKPAAPAPAPSIDAPEAPSTGVGSSR